MWLPVKEVSKLLGITERAIRLSLADLCEQEKYLCRCVDGVGGLSGMQYEILLESLPQSAQDKYNASNQEDEEMHPFMKCTEKQRAAASYRFRIITLYKQFKNNYDRTDKGKAFIRKYNAEHPDEKPISYYQLNRWECAYKKMAGMVL